LVAREVQRLGLSEWVHAKPYIHDMPLALAAADLSVARAGAMTIAELCAWGLPSILVPFPHAAANHQYHNAKALADAGAAVMLPETDLVPGRLWRDLVELATDEAKRQNLAARAKERGHPQAAAEIVEQLARLIPV
jgi:UDP-N-acetylglucosamine--N-acetylmuramyl-(pentapeptide) pyrophosphoryl-undecaprenol N-acetylglucosamine transferase